MSKCPKCNAEVESGAKFCDECGSPIPQGKVCPSCNAKLKENAKFCSECGYNFAQNGKSSLGIAMGDKNVVAGDVIGQKDDYHVSGNATFIKNEDETKKMVRCHVCGKNLPIAGVFTCPNCGEVTCEDCYSKADGVCNSCAIKIREQKESEYLQLLSRVFDDGKVEFSERRELKALQKKLGISDSRAQELESKYRKQTSVSDSVGEFELIYCQQAAAELWGKGDAKSALKIIEPVFKNHPHDQQVLSVYFPVLAFADEAKAVKAMDAIGVDSAIIARTRIDIDVLHDNLPAAEAKLKSALELWPDDVPLKCRRALCLYSTYVKFGKKNVLDTALEIVKSLPAPESKCERSWLYYLKSLFAPDTKSGFPKSERKALLDAGIYSALSNGDVFGVKPIPIDDLIKNTLKEVRKGNEKVELSKDELRALKSSAENNDPEAACIYGWYCVSKGKDVKEAVAFVKEAAEADVPDAQYLFGKYIDEGLVKEGDSYDWYKKAASSGHKKAESALVAFEKKQKEFAIERAKRQFEEEEKAKQLKKEKELADSKPLRELLDKGLVKIPDSELSIGKTQVTQALWKYIMGDNPSQFKGDDRPVESVSYYDCEEFIKRLNELETVRDKKLRFRLPTAKERNDLYKESEYNNKEDFGWLWTNSNYETHSVGMKKPNSLGLYDVIGNVAEWCEDVGEDWGIVILEDSRLCFGGCYLSLKSMYDYYSADTRSSIIGLRLVAFKI